MSNIFLEKSYRRCGGETNPRQFFKKLDLSISLGQQSEASHNLFLLYIQAEDYKNILKLRC